MTESEYRAAPGLNYSSLKDLKVSAYRFWYHHINPDRPAKKDTPFMSFGRALHCCLLQSNEAFEAQYACELDLSVIDGLLDTVADLRGWLEDKGFKPKGTKKQGLIEQVRAVDPRWPIQQVLEYQHAVANVGKLMLSIEDWDRLTGIFKSLSIEPNFNELMKIGEAEVPMFCEYRGITLKARLDWVRPDCTVDLKSFTQKRGKSIDETVADALWFEDYLEQDYFYTLVRHIVEKKEERAPAYPFVFIFFESEPPHEVRIKKLLPDQSNLYFYQAKMNVNALIDRYIECREQYGDRPWRSAQPITLLRDEEIKQLAW